MTCLIDLAAIFQGNYSIGRNKEKITDAQPVAQNDLVNRKPRLLEQVCQAVRTRHYSLRTEAAYVHWIKRFILYHHKRHPMEMGEQEINEFLSHLAVQEHVASSTQNQALCAIIFLYKHVLKKEIGDVELVWAKKPARVPVVLTREEVKPIFGNFL